MSRIIEKPTEIKAHGTPEKTILEFVGNVNTATSAVSIAKMISPAGWEEPGQTPEFDEYTVVLRGTLKVRTADATFDVHGGQAFIAERKQWVKYSSPYGEGAEYIAVCLPAFHPETVHREEK
jgi:mannose-6-phosphate isomerase-like protein (cupin superfamily)